MILAFFKYCYFWIDILGFLIQTFEPAPLHMFSYGVPPPPPPSFHQSLKLPVLHKIWMPESNFSSSNKFAYEKLKWKFFQRIRALNCKIVNCSVANELSSGKSWWAWFLSLSRPRLFLDCKWQSQMVEWSSW